jgi:O-antigen/teichoic acid export membrane protein
VRQKRSPASARDLGEPDLRTLRQRRPNAAGSLTLLLMGGGAQSLLRLAFAALTARLVSPSDTGVFQLALSVVLVMSALADPALTEATVRRGSQTNRSRSTFFWVNLVLALTIALSIVAGSPRIVEWLGQPKARPLLVALAVMPVIAALALGPFVELRRAHRFRDIALVETLACFAGCIAGAAIAFNGGGAWALFAYQLGWAGVRLVASTALVPLAPRLAFDLRALRHALRFSIKVWASRLTLVLAGQLDKLIVGALLGASVLGLYSRAALFLSLPLALIAGAAATVLVPSLAQHRGTPSRLQAEFLAATSLIATLTFPAFVGAAAMATPLVGALLGHGKTWEWSGVATLLAVMAPAAALDSLVHPQRSLLVAQGRVGAAMTLSMVGAGLLLSAITLGARQGLEGLAWGYVAATTLTFSLFTSVTLFGLKLPVTQYVRGIGRVVMATLAMALAIVLARRGLVTMRMADPIQLACLVALGAFVYALCLGRRRLVSLAGLLGSPPGRAEASPLDLSDQPPGQAQA